MLLPILSIFVPALKSLSLVPFVVLSFSLGSFPCILTFRSCVPGSSFQSPCLAGHLSCYVCFGTMCSFYFQYPLGYCGLSPEIVFWLVLFLRRIGQLFGLPLKGLHPLGVCIHVAVNLVPADPDKGTTRV